MVIRRVIFFILFFFSSTLLCAQGETDFVRQGFENVSVTKDSSEVIVTMELSAWKLKGEAIKKAIQLTQHDGKNYKFIITDNDIPKIVVKQKNGAWEVTRNTSAEWNRVKNIKRRNSSQFKVDLVFYPEIYLRNIKLEKMYDFMINLSPAIEMSLWRGMMLRGQIVLPLYNEYGEQFEEIRPQYVTVSQEFRLSHDWFLTATAGLFNRGRWGGDIQAVHYFRNERFAVRGRLGLTGPYDFDNFTFHYGTPKRLTWSVGGEYYLPRFNLQFNGEVGQFIGRDYGVRGDMRRHFKHASIGLFASKSNKGSFSGGFNFAIALPPYTNKRNRGFRVNTSNYFVMEYDAVNEPFYRDMYKTRPNENRYRDELNPYYIKKTLN